MLSTNNLAFAIKQKEVNHSVDDLMVVQSQILNRDSNGKVMVEKLPSTDHSRGGFHIPGIMLKYGEHPEDGAHRALTEELEVADRPVRLIDVQSHAGEKNSWYLIFLFESDPLSSEELSNPCQGIDELLHIDLNDTDASNSTSGVLDIKNAMATPGKTYV